MHNNLIGAVDAGRVSAFVMLDLSASFDTVDHTVLLSVLEKFQRLSVIVQRFNSVLILDSFCTTDEDPDL